VIVIAQVERGAIVPVQGERGAIASAIARVERAAKTIDWEAVMASGTSQSIADLAQSPCVAQRNLRSQVAQACVASETRGGSQLVSMVPTRVVADVDAGTTGTRSLGLGTHPVAYRASWVDRVSLRRVGNSVDMATKRDSSLGMAQVLNRSLGTALEQVLHTAPESGQSLDTALESPLRHMVPDSKGTLDRMVR
jgi:hypothetical protein